MIKALKFLFVCAFARILPSKFSTLCSLYRYQTDEVTQNVAFKYYDKYNTIRYISSVDNVTDFIQSVCNASDKYALIIPGWEESCEVDWAVKLVGNLTIHRGGCIMCMEYYEYNKLPYIQLLTYFDRLANVLNIQLLRLESYGFAPANGFMFGFSIGGQIATEAARRYGHNRISRIDICDNAGPGFDVLVPSINQTASAKNVQCIHTSVGKGTAIQDNCHQNWRMGICGVYQIASTVPPYLSHGLCPYIYLAAFDFDFRPLSVIPRKCLAKRPARAWPEGFVMGYREDIYFKVQGELFASTGEAYPYNQTSNADDFTWDHLTWENFIRSGI